MRQPHVTDHARIAPLATLPVFFKLKQRKVVLAGDSEGAVWKAELLAASGAALSIFTTTPDLFSALIARHDAITLNQRAWQADDLEGAVIALADVENDQEAKHFVDAAIVAGAAYNVIDRPAFCSFQFGSIVNRSPLLVAISTDGAAPVFGQAIRAKIEALLPQGLQAWAEAAQSWRPAVQARGLSFALRRHFWEAFTRKALDNPSHKPAEVDRDALLAMIDAKRGTQSAKGRVSLVGAGPGDPELLTLKALRVLQSADVILYDDLVSPEVLDQARREAKRICVGKTGHLPSCPQGEISALMVELARNGQHVVRLKSGDPGIFGRASEEIAACDAAGLPVSIVAGITAAQGAAADLGISLTERSHARRLQFLTGHSHQGDLPDDIHWAALADPTVTSVVYMPRKTLGQLRDRAIAAGLSPDTPAIAIQSATRAQRVHVKATISNLPESMGELSSHGPVLVMIGEAMRHVADVDSKAVLPLTKQSFSEPAEKRHVLPLKADCNDVLYNVCFVC
jgi:uroporphyrin-III C-methyltransferase/precorrin-2 dehydrogenase/sirohydrochlorin ferrochelatase